MFSFVGDTVLDPFMGTATTNLAAAQWGRNSIGIELDRHYFNLSKDRLRTAATDMFAEMKIKLMIVPVRSKELLTNSELIESLHEVIAFFWKTRSRQGSAQGAKTGQKDAATDRMLPAENSSMDLSNCLPG